MAIAMGSNLSQPNAIPERHITIPSILSIIFSTISTSKFWSIILDGPIRTILNAQFSTTVTDRTWMPHLPNFINRDIMYQMESDFAPEMKRTSGHQRRSYNDLQYQMMYTYYVIESPHNYPYQLIDHREHVGYCALTDDYFKNRYRLRKTRNERKKFICLNDDMKHHSSFVAKQTYDLVNKFYSEFYPNASTFEL